MTPLLPTLRVGDRIVATTRYRSIQQGDVVIFHAPIGAWPAGKIKRIIGLPGQTISSDGATVLINGHRLDEPYLTWRQDPGPPIVTQVIPAGHYFVMGDNRSGTADSRDYGPIPATSIVGIVTRIIAPASRVGPVPVYP